MTERARAWLQPGIIIQVLVGLAGIVGTYSVMQYRLDDISTSVSEIRAEVSKMRDAQIDVVRAQERMSALNDRMQRIEDAVAVLGERENQTQSRVSKLER